MGARNEIRRFVQELLTRVNDDRPLADDESLLESGRLQSIDAVEIAMFIEERFGVDFAEIGFEREFLDSIDAMCVLVERTAAKLP